MKCTEKILKEILLENGFKEIEYELPLGKTDVEYVPSDDVVTIIINEGISFRTTEQDARIRIDDENITFLTGYQDYWGGWFKNEMNIPLNIIKKLKIQKINF